MAESDAFPLPEPPPLRAAPDRGKVLCFVPHPDDEVIGPGGALCLHRRQGDEVRVVVATDGTAGDPDGRYDAGTLADRRRGESRRALAELGIDEVRFWGFPDACVLSGNDIELGVRRAVDELDDWQPATVYAPWHGERNPDHYALHVVVARALRRAGFTGGAWGYEIWDPMRADYVLETTAVQEAKRRALRCHESQLGYVDYERAMEGLNAYRSVQHLRGVGYGEAFCALRAADG